MSALAAAKCPSCGGADLRTIGKLPEVGFFAGRELGSALPASRLLRCPGCDLRFRHPVLDRSAYDALYGSAHPACWSDESARDDWTLINDYLAVNAKPGASILDFGCHTGGLLKLLGPRYSRAGVEVNESAAAVARERSGSRIFAGLDALPAGALFDFVTAVDVVEHFTDPGQVIASLLDAVRPGGALIITTGDAADVLSRFSGSRWWYSFYPEHLAFLSERWLRGWLRATGTRAELAEARNFRYVRHAPLRFVRQTILTSIYLIAPRMYVRLVRRLKRALGREGDVQPPGSGLTRDHVFLVLRKSP